MKTIPTKKQAEDAVRTLLAYTGEDVTREGILGTPERVARMFLEFTQGQRVDPPRIAVFDGRLSNELVIIKNCEFVSYCEHHTLPFTGVAHFAYVPADKIIGLSKFPRVVDHFAARFQLQERLTAQIADFLFEELSCWLMVVTEAEHGCMRCRGVRKQKSTTVTSAIRSPSGKKNNLLKNEALSLIRSAL